MCNCGKSKSKAKRKVRPHSRLIKGSNKVVNQPMVEKTVTETQPVVAPEEKPDVPSES